MRRRSRGRSRIVAAAAGGFLAGAITVAFVAWDLPNLTHPANLRDQAQAERQAATKTNESPSASDDRSALDLAISATPVATSPPVSRPPPPTSNSMAKVDADPVPELRDRQLELPVRDSVRQNLRDSFYEKRGSTRNHEAIDIMTPRNTPIVAVEDGTIARLFESKAGGNTVYQFDPTNRYVYYYAHLERYANGLKQGDLVRRGQLLGYAGTSGNASKDAPHLHFAIFRMTEQKQWWQGTPIDPYEVLKQSR
jgi:murein DD-endopeptidase MepM/ murein hydrolase activator NlpD